MSECAMRSAWTRCAPRATNISPTTDLPDAMPPVRPTFSNVPPAEERSPQSHRDTEKSSSGCSLCLCVSVVKSLSFAGQFWHASASPHLRSLHGVVHQHGDGQRTDAAGDRGQRSRDLNHLRMHIANQCGSLRAERVLALGVFI